MNESLMLLALSLSAPQPALVQGIEIRVLETTVVSLGDEFLVFYPDGTMRRCEIVPESSRDTTRGTSRAGSRR